MVKKKAYRDLSDTHKPIDPPATVPPAIQLAFAHFNELKVLQEENARLKETTKLSKLIDKAKGVLLEHEKLSE